MSTLEERLETARISVRDSEAEVARQCMMVDQRGELGLPTEFAEKLLTELQSKLVQHKVHLDRLVAEQAAAKAVHVWNHTIVQK